MIIKEVTRDEYKFKVQIMQTGKEIYEVLDIARDNEVEIRSIPTLPVNLHTVVDHFDCVLECDMIGEYIVKHLNFKKYVSGSSSIVVIDIDDPVSQDIIKLYKLEHL